MKGEKSTETQRCQESEIVVLSEEKSLSSRKANILSADLQYAWPDTLQHGQLREDAAPTDENSFKVN